jgi:hypothetical protein
MPKMTDEELVALIGQKLDRVINDDDGEVSTLRQENFNYYYGKPYGDERDGYSKVVTRECYEAIEWALPSILRVFTSGDRIVTFDPVGKDDEKAAEQETDVVNHFLLNEAQGFMVFYEWIKDALMYPNGYSKVWMEEIKEVKTEEYQGVPQGSLVQMMEAEGIEILEQESYPIMTELGPMELFNIKLRRTTTKPKLCLEAVPPEQALVDADCTSLNVDEAGFTCHRSKRTQTWLLQNGYKESDLEDVGGYDDQDWGSEQVNRLFYTDEDPDTENVEAPGMKEYWVCDIFMKVDFDGDGLAEERHIVLIGDTIFENEEYACQPLVALATTPGAHRHVGMSLIEAVKDIQRIQSTLMRQMLNNLYRINIRRKYVSEGALVEGGLTLEAIQNATTEIIPVRAPGMIEDEATVSVLADILPVMQEWQNIKKVRTGVSPDLALDPDILAKSTMGAFMGALENASQRLEMIVRIFAETGFKTLMLKVHKLLREYMDAPKTIKLRGEWVDINPAEWRERTNLTVNVGLGFNNKEKNIAAAMSLLQVQREAISTGQVQPDNLHNAFKLLIESYGFKDVDKFFTPPEKVPPKGPDPQTLALQAQIEAQKGQVEAAKQAVENDRQRVEIEAQRNLVEFQTKQLEAQRKQMDTDQKMLQLMEELKQGWAKIGQEQEKLAQGWTKLELDSKAMEQHENVPGSAV